MLKDQKQKDEENVLGVTYKEASDTLAHIDYVIQERKNKGFDSYEECETFMKEYHLDIAVYSRTYSGYRYVTPYGDLLTGGDWEKRYWRTLYWMEEDEKGRKVKRSFASKYIDVDRPRVYGERSDGKYPPLYRRNYFLPTGYYEEETGTFNVARPITVFARHSGADTSHIHELLKHIAGECYPYVLSWLRRKMLVPAGKTDVVPIFVGAQGTGKTTFGDSICTALFGEDNVLVTDQFDSTARFNADNANALIICIEEKAQEDKRNTAGNLKSRATARKVRLENKGIDPIFQDSYTDLVLTTNELVPLKFEDRGNQRRFMVMEVDPDFTRDRSKLADEVFTKLYGITEDGEKVGKAFTEDKPLQEQFKMDLWEHKGNPERVNYRRFPKTAAYHRCFNIPRTNEALEIEGIAKALVPFMLETLKFGSTQVKIKVMDEDGQEQELYLDQVIGDDNAFLFVRSSKGVPSRIALCRQVVFSDRSTSKPYAHSIVERTLMDLKPYFKEHGLVLLGDTSAPNNGFRHILGRPRYSPAAWFTLVDGEPPPEESLIEESPKKVETLDEIIQTELDAQETLPRIGQRVRFNDKFIYDEGGEFETLNELKPGCIERKAENAQYLDTFLLEADETTIAIASGELRRVSQGRYKGARKAEDLYGQRLAIQDAEATRLFQTGVACRVVYSGAKSLHILVRVEDGPSDLAQRHWLDAYLKATLSIKLEFDPATKDPTRLTRAPITKERITRLPSYDRLSGNYNYDKDQPIQGTQRLLAENWSNIYRLNWRPMYEMWLDTEPAYYERRGKMKPTKPIYKSAAIALAEGKFFSSRQWAGLRQETFFPAYRLLRTMGYTHDELWVEINSQLSHYIKKNEVEYWKTREFCNLIKTIDLEIEVDMEAENE